MRFLALLLFVMMSIQCIGQVDISGIVTDEAGEALIGANILAKGTDIGTVSDIDGSFSFNVGTNISHLVVSFVGFESKEVLINTDKQIHVVLTEPYIDHGCGWFGPMQNILLGGTYDFANNLGGVTIINTLPRFIKNTPLITSINYKMGNNGRLMLETRNEINLIGYYSNNPIDLALEIDYLKNAWFDYDITEGVDYRRFAILPKLSTRRVFFEAGYINQKELGYFSKSHHGVVVGFGMNTPFGFIVQGRTELLLDEVQYKLRLERYIPALRTSISVDYMHLEDFTSLSLSAQYRMWY